MPSHSLYVVTNLSTSHIHVCSNFLIVMNSLEIASHPNFVLTIQRETFTYIILKQIYIRRIKILNNTPIYIYIKKWWREKTYIKKWWREKTLYNHLYLFLTLRISRNSFWEEQIDISVVVVINLSKYAAERFVSNKLSNVINLHQNYLTKQTRFFAFCSLLLQIETPSWTKHNGLRECEAVSSFNFKITQSGPSCSKHR